MYIYTYIYIFILNLVEVNRKEQMNRGGAGEMIQPLRVLAALIEDLVKFPEPHAGLQPSTTLVPGSPVLLLPAAGPRHTHKCKTLRHTK